MYFNRFRKLDFKSKQQSSYAVIATPETSIHSMRSSMLPKMQACRCNCSDPQPDKILGLTGHVQSETYCALGACNTDLPWDGGCIMKNDKTDISLCCFDGIGAGKTCNTSEKLCGIGSATTLCGRPIDKCGSSPAPKKKNVVAYFTNWGAMQDLSPLEKATHVIVAFAVNYTWEEPTKFLSCSTEKLIFDPPNKTTTHAEFIKNLRSINPSVKILMSIGGANMNSGWAECLTSNNIENAATKMIDLFKNPDGSGDGVGYDGIDIDMENGKESDIVNTGKLVTELIRKRDLEPLDKKWLITVVPMSDQIQNSTYVTNIIKPNPGIDLINVQNYNAKPGVTPSCRSGPPSTFCGTSYADANTRCHAECDGTDAPCESFEGEHCYATANCGNKNINSTVCNDFNLAMEMGGISAEKMVPMIATNGPGLGCKWRCSNTCMSPPCDSVDCSNSDAKININEVACAYHKIDPNFGGLGYWAFNQDNIETGEAPASPQLLVQGLSDALNNLEGCSTCLAPLEC